jgi:peptide/nickel transport system substrate-binding protein
MKLVTFNNQEVAYQANPNWWAIKDLGLKLHFKYLVDLVNGSNNVMLGLFLQGNLDLSNNFLPGINSLLTNPIGGYPVETYYPKAPYMLSANTAWLEPNLTKAPMNNVNFRKALAYGISGQQIASVVYGDIVKPSSPTGLLPNLDPYVSKSVISKDGFKYNKKTAKRYLAKSGYHGQTLTLEVPDGWTDWMAAIQNISQQLKAIGINVRPEFPSYTARTSDLTNATYDLAIDNNQGASSDPYAYFQRVYRLPLNSTTAAAQDNWERFKSAAAWGDVLRLNSTPISDGAARTRLFSALETNFLQNLPEIPLWYNGAWAQYYTGQWKDWPTSTNKHDNYEPVMWRGYLGNMTTILGLANLRPA